VTGGAEQGVGNGRRPPYRLAALVLLVVALGIWWLTRGPEGGSQEAQAASAPSPGAPARGGAGPAPERPALSGVPAATGRHSLPGWLAQAEAPARRVAGHVTFEGQPVAAALVRLEPQPFPSGFSAPELRSGADGSFDFGLQPAMVHAVSASAPGRTEAKLEVDLRDPLAEPAPESLELAVTTCDARLVGHVLDSGGGPVEHARLRPASGTGVETNAAGEFELCLPPGYNTLQLSADGYGPMRVALQVLGKTRRDLLLTPEATIAGRVVTEDGNQPVADALVRAWPRQYVPGTAPASVTALSAADGAFRLAVAPGEYRVAANTLGASTRNPVQVSALGGRATDPVVLKLAALPTLRGHVKSAGKPVAGAHVMAMVTAGNDRYEAVSQEDGSFVISPVQPGPLSFTATPYAVVAPKSFVMPKASATVELEVKKKASLRGVVRSAGGKVVGGANIQVGSGFEPTSTSSGPDGRYVLKGLAAGTHNLTAGSERVGGFVEVKDLKLADGEDRVLDLELTSAASISGKVVSEQGVPVVGAVVVFTLMQTRDEGRGVTDSEGAFVCNAMTGGGAYKVEVFPSTVSRTPYSPAGEPFPPVALADGASHVEGVTLTVKYEQLSLSGRVVDLAGAPVPDAKVRALAVTEGQPPVFNPWMELPFSVTDAQGAFRIDGLTSGTWALQAKSPEGAEAVNPSSAAGATGVVITLRPTGGIDGTLVGYEEAPVVYAQELGGQKFVPGQVDGSTFHVSVPAGVYTVTGMNTREGDAQRVEVKEGAVSKVTLTSRGRGTLVGSAVEHTTRQPVEGAICHAVVTSGEQLGITNWDTNTAPTTDATGHFTVDPSPAGEIAVTCMVASMDYSSGSQRLVLPRGGRAEASLELVYRRKDAPVGDLGLSFDESSLTPQVRGVRAGSPAAKAGVVAGDVLTSIDGGGLAKLDSWGVETLIGNHPPGTAVKVGLLHGGQAREVALVTAAPP